MRTWRWAQQASRWAQQAAPLLLILVACGRSTIAEPDVSGAPAGDVSAARADAGSGAAGANAVPGAPDYPVLEKLPDDLPEGATVLGKYSGLVRVVPAPDENVKQGGFRDLGRLDASPTPRVTDLVGVYWVYSAPDWYVWKQAREAPLEAPPGADASGKYKQLLKRFAATDDLAEYGGFHDAGYRRTTDYKGLRDLPPGYWTYLAPYWYIWAEAHPLPLEAPDAARVSGTYDRLLRVVPAPDDAKTTGGFKDAGRLERPTYKGVLDIPSGYWVYVAPNWYVWGVNTKAPAPTPEGE